MSLRPSRVPPVSASEVAARAGARLDPPDAAAVLSDPEELLKALAESRGA